MQAQAVEQAHRDGACGLKILKTLGLYLRENITSSTLRAVSGGSTWPQVFIGGKLIGDADDLQRYLEPVRKSA